VHEVSYTSSRAEVWRWYWRAWWRPLGLWRHHAGIALAIAIAWTAREPAGPFDVIRFASAFGIAVALCLLLFPLWPQLRFKPQKRTLTIDASGFATQIGNLRGTRPWRLIRSVEDSADGIVLVGSNGNAMIVPNRAFPDPTAREAFLSDARRWHAGAA
jgi:hypothetical protein